MAFNNNITYRYAHYPDQDKVYLLIHGISAGIDSDFMELIFNNIISLHEACFMANFNYLDQGLSPSHDLKDEVHFLDELINYLKDEGYKEIELVAKSLGGIVASKWLVEHKDDLSISLVILGYVIGEVKTEGLKGKLKLIIQGENDRFGKAFNVQEELKSHGITAIIKEIPGADHSYRNNDREPVYQKQVIGLVIDTIDKIN